MKSSTIGSVILALCLGACGGQKDAPPEKEENATVLLDPWPDLNNNETLASVVADAIDRDSLKEKEGRFHAPDDQTPYTGWGKGIYPDGQAALVDRYKEGKLDGQTFLFRNGQRKKEGRFLNGSKEGLWIDWNEDGSERHRANFSNGEQVE